MLRICILCSSQHIELFCVRKDKHLGERHYWKCGECRLVFLDPEERLNSQEEKQRYDLHQNHPDDPEYVQFLNRLAQPVLERLKVGSEKGLDYGCGPEPVMGIIFKNRGWECASYDPIYYPENRLLSQKYDFITCSETAEHFYEPLKEFERIKGLMKEERSLCGFMTQMREDSRPFQDWWYIREPTHVCFYQPFTFQWIANTLDLEVEFPCQNVVIMH